MRVTSSIRIMLTLTTLKTRAIINSDCRVSETPIHPPAHFFSSFRAICLAIFMMLIMPKITYNAMQTMLNARMRNHYLSVARSVLQKTTIKHVFRRKEISMKIWAVASWTQLSCSCEVLSAVLYASVSVSGGVFAASCSFCS